MRLLAPVFVLAQLEAKEYGYGLGPGAGGALSGGVSRALGVWPGFAAGQRGFYRWWFRVGAGGVLRLHLGQPD